MNGCQVDTIKLDAGEWGPLQTMNGNNSNGVKQSRLEQLENEIAVDQELLKLANWIIRTS